MKYSIKQRLKKKRNSESHVSVFIHPFHDVCNFLDQFTDINWPNSGCFQEGHECYLHKCVQSIDGFTVTWI